MASTLSSTQADERFDGGVAPTVAKDRFTDVGEALAGIMHATYTPDARARAPGSGRSDDARISQSFAAPALGAADLGPRLPREQGSLGKRGTLARVAIAVSLVASGIWAWRSYGGPAPEQAAAPPVMSAPPARAASQAASIAEPATTAANEPGAAWAERWQVETSDLAALRQTVEQLAAGQEQLTRTIAKLQAEKPQADKPVAEKPDKRMLRRVSAQDAPTVAALARKPAPITPMPPQAARRVSPVTALSRPPRPASQMPSETQPSNPPPLRPPMPVPQP